MPFYAVARGNNIGIFETWAECQEAFSGFKGAMYKKFDTREDAQGFIDKHAKAPAKTSSKSSSSASKKTSEAPPKPKVYYAVAKGVKPGIYEEWTECQLAIKGFKGAKYKKFETKEEAQKFYDENKGESTPKQAPKKRSMPQEDDEEAAPSKPKKKTK